MIPSRAFTVRTPYSFALMICVNTVLTGIFFLSFRMGIDGGIFILIPLFVEKFLNSNCTDAKLRDPNKQANSFSLLLRLLVESSIRHQIAADSECYSFLSGVKQLSSSDPRIYSQVLKLLRSLHNLVKRPPRHTMNEEETYSRLQAGLNSTAVRSKPEFCIYVPRS